MSDLKQLTDAIHNAGISDPWFGGANIGGYCIQQDAAEFAGLVHILEGRPIRSYLQVGSAAGGSERFICERVGIRYLTIIDRGDHPQFKVWQNQNKPALLNLGVDVTEHIGDSHDEDAERFLLGRGPFDLVGIDGDHSPMGARMDWELIAPYLQPGSLVWMHDINVKRANDYGPREVWDKVKARHNVLLDTVQAFGIGLVEIV